MSHGDASPAIPAAGAPPLVSPSLRANRDFRLLVSGQAISGLGDAISVTAMPLLVLLLTGSGALMGVVAALQFVPDLLIGLPAGALADRWNRRRLMAWSDVGRAALTALIPISYWLGGPTIVVILLVAIPINALRVLSDTALWSSVPGLVGKENLARANSLIESVLSVPFIIGPAAAGLLVAAIGAASTIALDAVSFALSALSVALIGRSLRAERPAAMPSVLTDIRAGITFVAHQRLVRALIGYWTLIQVATVALVPMLGYYLLVERQAGPELFGLLGSSWSLGYLGGSILAGRLSQQLAGRWLVGGGAVTGAGILAIALTAEPLVYIFGAAMVGIGLAIGLVFYSSLRATATPDEMLGRVGSAARTVVLGVQPLALVGFGAIVDAASATLAILLMGGLAVGASVAFALVTDVRRARLGEAG